MDLPSLAAVLGLGVESESKMSMGRASANNNEPQKCSPLMEQVEYTFNIVTLFASTNHKSNDTKKGDLC